ncbi:MAG: hypothetical protein DA408_10425 [Bacteroidetes bacterium]|nr:MAG: hypothetical protein C7N36_09140 [Bacteroidota bacterium]PTM12472.1 MAG: hypothetical protein DA408_10425 [Bacteroidota bacterium]
MTKEKSSGLVKIQFVVFGILLLVFLVWANRQCSRSQQSIEAEQRAMELAQANKDSLALLAAQPPAPAMGSAAAATDTIGGGQMQIIREKRTPLYVTIDNLALRKGPGVNYEILDRFPLFEELSFLNEVTDSMYTIKLGTNLTTIEPWVKVRSRKGRDGWVYGAGVDYYKHQLPGVDL